MGGKDNKFPNGELSERILEKMMHEIKVEPSEAFKEKSFQAALEGIGEARRKARRRKMMKRVRDVALFGAVTAAAILLVFQFMLADQPGNTAQNPDTPTADEHNLERPQDPDQKSPEGKEEQPDPETERDESKSIDRPQTKEIVTWPEGVEERMVYNLYTHESMPFSTYLFPEWEGELVNRTGPNNEPINGVYISPVEYDYGEIEILFFPVDVNEEEVKQYVLDNYVQNNPYQTYPADNGKDAEWFQWEVHDWPLITYRYQVQDEGRLGYVRIGEHNDQLFLIQEEYLELGEAFPHRSAVLYQEWIWTDTGEPLQSEWHWPTPPTQ